MANNRVNNGPAQTAAPAGYANRSKQKAGMMAIQDLVAMGSGMKSVIPPTYQRYLLVTALCNISKMAVTTPNKSISI